MTHHKTGAFMAENTTRVSPPATNRLKDELSPYLLQHAANPVDWYPWGDEAFARAQREQRLIFLSIGYATCHWCHVMEQESFVDDQVAQLLNRDFVAIKVDREERPDIDQFYMRVATHLTGQGGWPLTIVMTPDKLPLFAATYLPKEGRYNRPGLLELLPQIVGAWRDHPQKLLEDSRNFVASLAAASHPQDFSAELLERARCQVQAEFDGEVPGFGPAPRFPRPHLLRFLLQRFAQQQDADLRQMILRTLSAMRGGGIYDHLAGGFHRYATDRYWLLPHFEKMLYDQAGLADAYLEAYRLWGRAEDAQTARDIFAYLLTRLRDPVGAFHSAEDADTQGVEGATYVWTQAEVNDLLGAERAKIFSACYQLKTQGNFHDEATGKQNGQNILHRQEDLSALAVDFGMEKTALEEELSACRQILLRARDQRAQPGRDDKILAAWNGLAISALSRGAVILEDPRLLDAALEAADFVRRRMQTPAGQLLRRWRLGQASIQAFAEDYAALARAWLDLYHATLEPQWLGAALDLAEELFAQFVHQGQVFTTPVDHELPQRTTEVYDGAAPSATSLALEVTGRLFSLTHAEIWQRRGEDMMRAASAEVGRYPQGYLHFLAASERLLSGGCELVVVGQRGDPATEDLLRTAWKFAPAIATLLFVARDNPAPLFALAPQAKAHWQEQGAATAFVCRNYHCLPAVNTGQQLQEQCSGSAP